MSKAKRKLIIGSGSDAPVGPRGIVIAGLDSEGS